ncbi:MULTISPECIES: hypothetical protein [Methylophilaceae]|uniref:hypothetical protein n=1 Tax=Methylophilaceae TaxID=32011 RepID=UPI0012D7F476|nr:MULTISPECIES: hypothetical protein [Methylophilaceae]
MNNLLNLLRVPSALSRARSLLAYPIGMSRRSLRGFAHMPRSLQFIEVFYVVR